MNNRTLLCLAVSILATLSIGAEPTLLSLEVNDASVKRPESAVMFCIHLDGRRLSSDRSNLERRESVGSVEFRQVAGPRTQVYLSTAEAKVLSGTLTHCFRTISGCPRASVQVNHQPILSISLGSKEVECFSRDLSKLNDSEWDELKSAVNLSTRLAQIDLPTTPTLAKLRLKNSLLHERRHSTISMRFGPTRPSP